MGVECKGLEEFLSGIELMKSKTSDAIEKGLNKNCIATKSNASELSRRDTGTLKKSWELNKDNEINQEGEHQKEVWSNPSIIATNPKHPNGRYYAWDLENGWTDRGGIWHEGDHMLQSSITISKQTIRQDILEELNKLND